MGDDRIREWIGRRREAIVGRIGELVRFDTANGITNGKEKACNLRFAEWMGELGLDVDVFTPDEVPGLKEHPAYYPGKDYAERPNAVGVWKGTGGGRSLVFSGHIDTTYAAEGWETDPWTPFVEDGKLYGLGVFDMKSGLAAALTALQCLKELGVRLRGDLIVESVVDEEFGGANGTLACRLRGGYRADAAIIPEPTNLAVCPATRGGAFWRATFRGRAGMSFSGEELANPVREAARFIAWLEELERSRSASGGPAPWYGGDARELPIMVTRVVAGDPAAVLCDSGPATCEADIWMECYPGETEESLREEVLEGYRRMRGWSAEGSGGAMPELRSLIRFLPGAETATDFPLIGVLTEETARATGQPTVVQGAPFACDAFMFQLHSPTPALVMGPVGSNAHAPAENIELDALFRLIEIYARTAIRWCGADGTGAIS